MGNNAYARTFSPCFRTTDSSLSAMPLGRFAPVSHFWTVDSLLQVNFLATSRRCVASP
jgi:hypothetical protein